MVNVGRAKFLFIVECRNLIIVFVDEPPLVCAECIAFSCCIWLLDRAGLKGESSAMLRGRRPDVHSLAGPGPLHMHMQFDGPL